MLNYLKILIGFFILIKISLCYANIELFIRDYFSYKKIGDLVVISCNDYIDGFYLTKIMNEVEIFVAIDNCESIIDVTQILKTEHRKLGVTLDMRCNNENIHKVILDSSKNRMYNYLYNWLMISDNLNETIMTLNDTSYSMITDVVVAVTDSENYVLYDVFNHCKYRGGRLNVTQLGQWDTETGLVLTLNQSLISRRKNLQGMILKTSGVIQYRPPHMALEVYLKDVNTRSLDSMSKFAFALITHMSELFNFSVQASEIIFWDIHSLHGAIFDVMRENYIDFGLNPRVMVAERLDYAKLVGAAWPVRPCFLLLSVPSKRIKLEPFLKPFGSETWCATIIFSILMMLVLFVIITREYFISHFDAAVLATIDSIGILSQQGTSIAVIRFSSRIALVIIVLFSWLLYNYYSASIVSARLNEPPDRPDDTVTVLADSDMKIAAEAVPYLTYLLEKYNWESDYFRKKRWDPLPDTERYLPIEEGIERVREGKMAYHTDPNTAYPYIEKTFDAYKICQLAEIHLFKQSMMGIYTSHNQQFFELAKLGLTRMFSSGLRDRQIKYWSSEKPRCDENILLMRSFTIYESAPAFILLVIGLFVSSLIYIIEYVIFRQNGK